MRLVYQYRQPKCGLWMMRVMWCLTIKLVSCKCVVHKSCKVTGSVLKRPKKCSMLRDGFQLAIL
ncbi:Uncharacterised protein [Vibrio cholerae]|nr:Uncharacterised protein [Vibrio cholerae]CSI46285.1 Uncharacterised protein [Vibrio cholerae]